MNYFHQVFCAALKIKLLRFHIYTPSGQTKKKRISYPNKKRENGKLKIQQPSSFTFMFLQLKAHANRRNKSQQCCVLLADNVASVCMGF